MEPQHGRAVDQQHAIQFYSGAIAPYHLLSNFSEAEVVIDNVSYPSSEHAFQAALSLEGVEAFSSSSAIGKLTPAACGVVGFPPKKLDAKCAFWSKKRNVGILAKMLIAKHKKAERKRQVDRAEVELLFKKILLDKYRRNPKAREALLSTGNAYLYEFVRSANSKFTKKGVVDRWGAMIVDGKVVGDNQMGALMMWVREQIRQEK